MYDQQPETPDPIRMAAIMATEDCSMEDCCNAAKCIRDLHDEVKLLRDLGVRQRAEIEELNSMQDAVERLRDIGKVVGCDHVDDPDGRLSLINCVESTIDELHRLLLECQNREQELRIITGDIEQIRNNEGNSVMILCDDPDEDGKNGMTAVVANGDFTDWEDVRYWADSWPAAMAKAADASRRFNGAED